MLDRGLWNERELGLIVMDTTLNLLEDDSDDEDIILLKDEFIYTR